VPVRDNPYSNFNFLVQIDGEDAGGFSEVHVGAARIELIEYREGSDKTSSTRKLPGRVAYDNVVLKRGLTGNTALWDWFKTVRDGTADRRTVRITLLDEAGRAVFSWTLARAMPVKYEAGDLKAHGNEVSIETLELAHEGLELE
jgi:phage tail-like protein